MGPLIPIQNIPHDLQMHFSFMERNLRSRQLSVESYSELIKILKIIPAKIDVAHHVQRLKRLQFWIQKDQRIRGALKRFVQLWLYRRYGSRMMNTEDPATLMEPRIPIHIYDTRVKGTYIFDAFSLRRLLQMNLTFTEWMFPEPCHPKNPLTNMPFTMPQVMHIIPKLRAANATNWWIEAYYQSKFDLKVFEKVFCIPLKLNSLTELVRNRSSEEYIEYLEEFIEDQFDIHDVEFTSHLTILKWAVAHLPNDAYMIEWAKIMYDFTKIRILYSIADSIIDHILLEPFYVQTRYLFNKMDEIARLGRVRLASIPRPLPPSFPPPTFMDLPLPPPL